MPKRGQFMKYITPGAARRGSMVIQGGKFKGTIFTFPLNPETIRIRRAATYADHPIPGRSEPVSHYIHGSQLAITMSLPLEAKSEMMYMSRVGVKYFVRGGTEEQFPNKHSTVLIDGGDKLLRCYYFLDSLCLPRELDSLVNIGAPPFLFVWGTKLRWMCTMRSVELTMQEFQPGSNTLIRATAALEMSGFIRGGTTHEERLVGLDRDMLDGGRRAGAPLPDVTPVSMRERLLKGILTDETVGRGTGEF